MATTIFFNGRLISKPGSYSEVDASGLETVGLGASGIVAVLGEAEGGIPVSALASAQELQVFTKPEAARAVYRSGDLREVAGMLFEPSSDEDILGGAQQFVGVKVNPATQSVAVLPNAYGDALDLTSKDYGEFTQQVNIQVATGTSQGKLLTIIFEDVTESVDNLGGDVMFRLKYTAGTDSWETMRAQVVAGGNIEANGTRDQLGLDGDIVQMAGNDKIEVVSTDAGDTMQITVWGLDAAGNAQREVLSLQGTTIVVGNLTFSKVYAAKLASAAAGTVTVADDTTATTIITLAPATTVKGGVSGVAMYVSGGKVSLVADGATTKNVVIEGQAATGVVQREKVVLTGAVAVQTVGDYSSVTFLALGDVEAARTLTISAEVAKSQAAIQTTLQKAADFWNARKVGSVGFTWTQVSGLVSFLCQNLDVQVSDVDILHPADPAFYADLYTMAAWITQNSAYVDAAVSSGATGGAVSNTTSPVFLAGGSEGSTAFADWQAGLNILKQKRVNSVVVLTGDPAVHAALEAHCAYMGGIGRSERDGFAGVLNTGLTDVPTKTEYKAAIVDLNSRHIRAFGQAIERYNSAGERQEFLSPFQGAVAAGMQAGSPVGTSLTHKLANVLSVRQDQSWNPVDDAEELIQAGACFMETVDNLGRRWVRNVTTHLSSNNLVFTEASVNEAVNYAVFEFRTEMENVVGARGFSGTLNAAKGAALQKLGALVDETVLTTYRALALDLVVDVLEISCEMAPTVPINFVKNTIHLVTTQQTA